MEEENHTILKFGKYSGSSIFDVLKEDPRYCQWLKSQEMLLSGYPQIRDLIRHHLNGDDTSYVMTWGKYKSRTLKWIKARDHDYLKFLMTNKFVKENCPKLLKEIIEVMKTYCDVEPQ